MNVFQPLSGNCPKCGNLVNIIEAMVYEYSLDANGDPFMLESENYKVAGFCKNCGEAMFVMPNENGGYTVYPPDVNVARLMQRDKHQRSSALGMKLLDKEHNPFVNVTEDDCPF